MKLPISTLSLLGVLFVGLKLTDYIDWSWWWVTLPFWGIPALILGGGAIVFLSAIIVEAVKMKAARK